MSLLEHYRRMRELPQPLVDLARRQTGVLSRQQLQRYGVTSEMIAARVRRGFWKEITSRVISTNPRALTREEELWAAALHFPNSAITGAAALELDGLKPDRLARIDILATRGGRVSPRANWRLHTSSRLPNSVMAGLRRTTRELSLINAVGWAVSDKQAIFYTTWAVQKKLVTLEKVADTLSSMPRSTVTNRARRRLEMVRPGAMSSLEQLFIDLCSRYEIPIAALQDHRQDSEGRNRYIDAVVEYEGRRVLVEIDGQGHLDAEVQLDDAFRANDVTRADEVLIRIPGIALFTDSQRFMLQLREKLGMPPWQPRLEP